MGDNGKAVPYERREQGETNGNMEALEGDPELQCNIDVNACTFCGVRVKETYEHRILG